MKNKPTQNIEKIIRFQIDRNLRFARKLTKWDFFYVFRPLCNENCCKAKWKIFCAVNTFWCVFCKLWVWALDFYENTFRNHFIGQKIAELRANAVVLLYTKLIFGPVLFSFHVWTKIIVKRGKWYEVIHHDFLCLSLRKINSNENHNLKL